MLGNQFVSDATAGLCPGFERTAFGLCVTETMYYRRLFSSNNEGRAYIVIVIQMEIDIKGKICHID
jgi:hypothetical protein